jgi:hypothetical protein
MQDQYYEFVSQHIKDIDFFYNLRYVQEDHPRDFLIDLHNLQIDNENIVNDYEISNGLVLRKYNNEKGLLFGCGNGYICTNSRDETVEKNHDGHKGWYTIDVALCSNASVLIDLSDPKTNLKFIPNNSFNLIDYEFAFSTMDSRYLKEIMRVMKKDNGCFYFNLVTSYDSYIDPHSVTVKFIETSNNDYNIYSPTFNKIIKCRMDDDSNVYIHETQFNLLKKENRGHGWIKLNDDELLILFDTSYFLKIFAKKTGIDILTYEKKDIEMSKSGVYESVYTSFTEDDMAKMDKYTKESSEASKIPKSIIIHNNKYYGNWDDKLIQKGAKGGVHKMYVEQKKKYLDLCNSSVNFR